MKAHLIKLGSEKELAQAALRLGASEASLRFFEARRETLQIYVTDVPSPAASIIKQEMLSRGGDAHPHRFAATPVRSFEPLGIRLAGHSTPLSSASSGR